MVMGRPAPAIDGLHLVGVESLLLAKVAFSAPLGGSHDEV
jgi:hypothetical protein